MRLRLTQMILVALAGAALAAPLARASDLAVRARRGGDEAQGAAHRARRQAAGRRLGAPGGPLPARQPQGRLRESQLPRERVHREPERSREQPSRPSRTGGGSISGTSWRQPAPRPGGRTSRAPGRTRRTPAFPEGGGSRSRSSTPASPTGTRGPSSPTTPTCRRSRASSARRTSSTAISSRSTRTATAPTWRARSRRQPTTAGASLAWRMART